MPLNTEKVYDLHQHTHCLVTYIGKTETLIEIIPTTNRNWRAAFQSGIEPKPTITYNKQRTEVTGFGGYSEEEGEDDIVIDNFLDGLYSLFKKDKENWNEEDKFLIKAVSDYLLLAVKKNIKENKQKIENFDLLHYVFIVPSDWEEEIRDDIIRPIFIQSGLISKEDHPDRLLFYTNIESVYYYHYFKRGNNSILCRLTPEEDETIINFHLLQTTTTLFNIPNAKLFPKVMNSSSVSIPKGALEGRIKDFLRTNLFPVATLDNNRFGKLLKCKLVPSNPNQIIEAIIEEIYKKFRSLENEHNYKFEEEKEPWISFNEEWMLTESQKEFINSLCPSVICAEISTFLLDCMKDIISNNFTKSYMFFLLVDIYTSWALEDETFWLIILLKYNSRSLNFDFDPDLKDVNPDTIVYGAVKAVFEAIQHSDIYCKPRIISSADLSTSSSIFLNSKPDAIVNLDISLGSTLFTCSILDANGLIKQIFDQNYFIQDKHLSPLEYFYAFSNKTKLNIKELFIPFAERYLLGDLSDLIAGDGTSIKKDLLLEIKSILTKNLSDSEALVSTYEQKYINAFLLMYMVYIKEEIMYKFFDQFIPDQKDMKIGYAISIEAMLLNKTIESKDNLRDVIYTSGLVPKDDHSKKLRITTQGERILPAIQKFLKLEFSLRSYFLLCQLHEDYIQLSLHQVVTEPSSEGKEQESIFVQDEILPIQNIYDSLCSTMWFNLLQDNSLIDLCEMHDKSDNDKIINLLSSKVKTAFFASLKGHISDNVLQNNPNAESTNTINLTSSCDCKVRLTVSDLIDISFRPVLQDIACTLSASLLNNKLFGNYMNIDYLFSFIRFNNNPQLQYAFTRILEEEAGDFNLELGVDTSCLVIPELFSQLLQPVISQQPLCYKDFKIGALQQVSSKNYGFSLSCGIYSNSRFKYKSKITDTKSIACGIRIAFPFLSKGEVINNVPPNRKFYLCVKKDSYFGDFYIDLNIFEAMNYSENNETFSFDDNIYQRVDSSGIFFVDYFSMEDADVPVMVSIRYVSYTSSFQFFVKIVGADTKNRKLMCVMEIGEPLTLARL